MPHQFTYGIKTTKRGKQRMIRVAIVTNYIPDYRYPVFQRVKELCSAQLKFFTSSPIEHSCEIARKHFTIKPSRGINVRFRTRHRATNTTQREMLPLPLSLVRDLIGFRPSIIISGDFGLRSLLCWITSRLIRSRFILWSEDITSSARNRSQVQKLLRRFLAKHADGFLAWGTPSRDYLLSLGAQSELIHLCQQAVDNDFWVGQSNSLDRAALRSELDFHGTAFLLTGRLVERKGFHKFIEAWHMAGATLDQCSAIIVGSGDQLDKLQRLVEHHGLSNIRFVHAQSPHQLARYYAAADVFVFPSLEDVWGMVVNEALCFNLPILASKYAGASQGLIADAMPDSLFDPVNISEFSQKLIALAQRHASTATTQIRALLNGVNFESTAQTVAALLNTTQDQSNNSTRDSSSVGNKMFANQVLP